MDKETTYNKYKRENKQLRAIINLDVRSFTLNVNNQEFNNRLDYIKKCIMRYRAKGG